VIPDWLVHPVPHQGVEGAALNAFVLLDVALIVALARVLGGLMVRIRQPRVVGEILAGVLLGPTLIGSDISEWIAPLEVRPMLGALATIALVMFMFIAGIEYDPTKIRGRAHQAGLLAVASVGLPALLGFPIAMVMHTGAYAGPEGSSFFVFALFIGAALSVTAFPVMAHILMERGQLNSRLGSLGIATTCIMSVLMFTYIAVAGAVATASGFSGLAVKLGLTAAIGVLSLVIVQPALARFLGTRMTGDELDPTGLAVVLTGMVVYGLLADRLGINALVGGFAWGLLITRDEAVRASIAAKVRDVSMSFFLPIFFAISGFATDLKQIDAGAVPVLVLFLGAAVVSKFIGAAPARTFGMSWRETWFLGALFNTRGLLVLVVGLIGLQAAIITPLTFTMIVVVALITNLMTLPIMEALSRSEHAVRPVARVAASENA
jgi:Kef-type K+ transport system membrane component KefB